MSIMMVEDRINSALNAMLVAHDYTENVLDAVSQRPELAENANAASYAIGNAREAVRAAQEAFQAYLVVHLAERKHGSREGVE